MSKYCVIGAGAAGLPALKMLLDEGYEVDCFEKSDKVGGHWNTDYDFLHLITSRNVTGYDHWPMPEDFPLFPSKDLMLKYFNMYAEHFGLFEKITFNTEVNSVKPLSSQGLPGSNGWEVTTSDGKTKTYDGVFIANGHLTDCKTPEFPGEFTGKQIHSGRYKNTKETEGRVLVVGAGNSGCDLAVDCAQDLIDTSIVIRRGQYFQPKTFFGKPRAELEFMKEFTFEEQDLITRLMMKLSVGTAENYGLPPVEHNALADGPPVVNNLLMYWIHHGRIKVKPGIQKFEGKKVYFEDGTVEEFDTILWATGFHCSLPMLEESLIERSKDAVPLRYGAGIVPVGLEKLYYIGLIAARGGQPMQYPIQMELAIRMAKLHEKSPSGVAPVAKTLASVQEKEWRVDILRPIWFEQIEHTKAVLAGMEAK